MPHNTLPRARRRGLLPSPANMDPTQKCTHRKTELHLLVHTLVADEYETKAKSPLE